MNSEKTKMLAEKAKIIEEMLDSFGIKAKVMEILDLKNSYLFKLSFARGIKFEDIESLSKTLSISLASPKEIEIKLIPGEKYIGIYLPEKKN